MGACRFGTANIDSLCSPSLTVACVISTGYYNIPSTWNVLQNSSVERNAFLEALQFMELREPYRYQENKNVFYNRLKQVKTAIIIIISIIMKNILSVLFCW